ncbi:hypothetical protein [Aestuariispira insulae]|uniref:7-cyano-7-deazaguanine reductase n=1 Tax=Aestuariispira insulae TaxID=1461337 RepID=A0A3D9HSC2_9PROT|nr:hypothetical protein [Aestuariispira insulae]RED52413.1 7-cyano-7-deazaguanine reductase [Aestuariispira insulae]
MTAKDESQLLERGDMPDRIKRQSTLETAPNPNPAVDYLCELSVKAVDDYATVHLFYVPDKLLLTTQAFELYLHEFDRHAFASLEELALTILDDLNNELVARWIQIRVEADAKGLDRGHRVMVEDRQPKWDNGFLLARLAGF